MNSPLVECVPNFSEGRDPELVRSIANVIESLPGVAILGCERDPDHHRSVITFVGPPERIVEAAVRATVRAVELIDLRRHQGVHPRIGAADVIPFVPLRGVTLEVCAGIAEQVGREIWNRLGVPVYLYEAAARIPERRRLEQVRKEVKLNPDAVPDIGTLPLHSTAGASVVGARKLLIAYNVNLATPDVEIARRVARAIRFSSGGLPHVKALGLYLQSRNQAQVSTNLTDFEQTPPHQVFKTIRQETERMGVEVAGSEIVGLIPRKALDLAGAIDLRWENLRPESILEHQLALHGLQ